jgi:hypothetical protein
VPIETLSSLLPIIPGILKTGKSAYDIIIKPLLLGLNYKISDKDEEELRKLESKDDIEGIKEKINIIEREINLRQNTNGNQNSQIGVNNGIVINNPPIIDTKENSKDNYVIKNDIQIMKYEFNNMTDVKTYIINKIVNIMGERHENQIEFKIFGMRFGAIKGILIDLMYKIKSELIFKNKLIIYLYFCNPEYLRYIGKYGKYSKSDEFKQKIDCFVSEINVNINDIKRNVEKQGLSDIIEIHYKQYYEIPTFWAFEIDNKDYIWGYFLWNKNELDWVGPQNKCFLFNNENRGQNGFINWIKNNFDRLDEWSRYNKKSPRQSRGVLKISP